MASRYVGVSVRRFEDAALLRGEARYLDDLRLPGTLAVAFLRSPHAHARIQAIGVERALEAPGVVAALTGPDLARTARPVRARLQDPGYKPSAWPALPVDKVRFVGEPVVAVVAADRYRAEDALDRIEVRYETLAAVTDVEGGMEPGAPRLHEDLPDNVLLHARFDNGRLREVAGAADLRLSASLRHPRCSAAPLENRGVIAYLDRPDGALTVWASTQAPHLLRTGLAEALDLPESRIRVIAPGVGGGFGMKMHLFPEDIALCALALRLVGRPLKWCEDRRENLLASAHSREQTVHVEVYARRDGTLLGLRARLLADVGAYSIYPVTAALDPVTAAGILPGPYRILGYSYDAYAVATNKCPAGAYRGVGMTVGTFVRERIVDMVAARAGLDPAEVRRRNFIGADAFPFATASGLVLDSGDPTDAFDRLLRAAGYDELRADQRRAGSATRRGIGLCS